MLERAVEDHLVRRVKETGGEIRKVVWAGHKGAPDRLAGWPSNKRHALVELKKPKGKGPEAHQSREHAKLRSIGFEVWVIHTKEQVDAFILEMTS
jgi:hypothetical protein